MAGQAGKKDKKKKDSNRLVWKASILVVTILYILINGYSVYFKEYKITRSDTFGFLILTIINFVLYRLLDMAIGSFFYLHLIDLLIINLSVELLINFHWKFWFLYLVIPGYFLFKGAGYIYEHVKTVGKVDPNAEEEDPRSGKGKSNSQKQKREIIKSK
jgi:hypothetical protein